MAALTKGYKTLLQRLACRSNQVLTMKEEVPTAVGRVKMHRQLGCLGSHVQLERDMKGSFEVMGDVGFGMLIALIVAL